MTKVEIDINKPLDPGDVIELHFKSVGLVWLQAAQIGLIESRLKNRPEFGILSWSITDDTNVVFTVKIKKTNPVLVTAAVIAAIIIGTGFIAWLLLDKVYQISESPAGQLAMGGLGTLAIVMAIAGLLALLPKGK